MKTNYRLKLTLVTGADRLLLVTKTFLRNLERKSWLRLGGTPHDGLYAESPSQGVPFS